MQTPAVLVTALAHLRALAASNPLPSPTFLNPNLRLVLSHVDELDTNAFEELLALNLVLRGARWLEAPSRELDSNGPRRNRIEGLFWAPDREHCVKLVSRGNTRTLEVVGHGAVGVVEGTAIAGDLRAYRWLSESCVLVLAEDGKGWLTLYVWTSGQAWQSRPIVCKEKLSKLDLRDAVDLSARGRWLAIGCGDGYGTVRVIDTAPARAGSPGTPCEAITFCVARGGHIRVGVSPSEDRVAAFPVVATLHPKEFPGVIVDLATGARMVLAVDGVTRGICWSPCGRWIASYQEPYLYRGSIRVYDAASGAVVARLEGLEDPDGDGPMADSSDYALVDHDRGNVFSWESSGDRLRVLDRKRNLWLSFPVPGGGDAPTVEQKPAPRPASMRTGQGAPEKEIAAPDHVTLLYPFERALVWNLAQKRLLFRDELPGPPTQVASDGLLICGGSPPGWVLLVRTGRILYLGNEALFSRATSVSPAPGGAAVLLIVGESILLVDLVASQMIWTRSGLPAPPTRVVWNASGDAYFTASPKARVAHLWDAATGVERAHWPWTIDARRTAEIGIQARGCQIVVMGRYGQLAFDPARPEPFEV